MSASEFAMDRARTAPFSREEIAAEWVVRERAGLAPSERVQLANWINADDLNARAFDEARSAMALFHAPRASGQADAALAALAVRDQARARRRRKFQFVSVGLAAAAALILAFVVPLTAKHADSAAPTMVKRPDRTQLPDGSTVELNAGAKIEVAFTATQRSVKLLQGEALFFVAKNPQVPFVVSAGGVDVRAVGTAFVVRHDRDQVKVLVTEGRVAVERGAEIAASPADAQPLFLDAGLQVSVPTSAAPATSAAATPVPVTVSEPQIAAALAWRDMRVEFSGTTLAEAAALFNGQNRAQIDFADEATASRQLTGVFWADDVEAFVRLLDSGLDVANVRDGDRILLRQR